MKNRLFLLLITAFFTNTPFGQELNDFFSTLYEKNLFNGSVVISKSDKSIFSKNYGFSNTEKKEKLNDNSQFTIASITKTFTSTAILQLQQSRSLIQAEYTNNFN